MTNQELSRKILELVGGKKNVVSATSCMTRLRIQLKDRSLANIPGLKATEGGPGCGGGCHASGGAGSRQSP